MQIFSDINAIRPDIAIIDENNKTVLVEVGCFDSCLAEAYLTKLSIKQQISVSSYICQFLVFCLSVLVRCIGWSLGVFDFKK